MPIVSSESVQAPHHTNIIGFLQHASIAQEVKRNIHPERTYTVIEITGADHTKKHTFLGQDIRHRYSEIFSNWRHGFIVYEEGYENGEVLFAYGGPIVQRVQAIMTTNDHDAKIH